MITYCVNRMSKDNACIKKWRENIYIVINSNDCLLFYPEISVIEKNIALYWCVTMHKEQIKCNILIQQYLVLLH